MVTKLQPKVYAFEGVTPVIDPSAYVHPSAVLIGDVIVGPRCYVGGCAVMRGDFGRIELHEEANLQDNCTVHSDPKFDCVMETRSLIGHGAVVHAARIKRDALVGMNSVIMDRAVVGEQAFVAAMSFVKIGGVIDDRVLAAGVPARTVRPLAQADMDWKRWMTDWYVELAQRSLNGMTEVQALTQVQADRPRIRWQYTTER